MIRRISLLVCAGAVALAAQTTINGSRSILGTWDASGSAHSLPSKKGTRAAVPPTCTVGEEYFAIDATAGQNKYYCTATNTWTQQSGGGSASGASTHALVFDGSTTTLADGSSITWASCFRNSKCATWNVPASVGAVYVEAWGGGAAGSGSTGASGGGQGGAGGAGGGYGRKYCAVTPGSTIMIQVGQGGTTGAGYGSIVTYPDASAFVTNFSQSATATASWSGSSSTMTVSSVSGTIAAGNIISGAGIPSGTVVANSYSGGTSVPVSFPANTITALPQAGSGVSVTFYSTYNLCIGATASWVSNIYYWADTGGVAWTAAGMAPWGPWFSGTSFTALAAINSYATGGTTSGTAGWNVAREDQGGMGGVGWGGSSLGTGGNAGIVYGGGGGGGGAASQNATGGMGAVSVLGGAGGSGGSSASACTAGTPPGGGGGGAYVGASGTVAGCAGARGEVRLYYAP